MQTGKINFTPNCVPGLFYNTSKLIKAVICMEFMVGPHSPEVKLWVFPFKGRNLFHFLLFIVLLYSICRFELICEISGVLY